MAPPHRVHRASAPQWAQARSRARPFRLRMHTTRPSGRSSTEWSNRASRSENRPVRGSSPVRSTTSTTGHPRRSTAREVVTTVRPSARATGGQRLTRATGAPSRRARSTTTSTADQVGARSSRYASSWASRTTAATSLGTGAHAAARVPTTTPRPDAACSHPSGARAVPDSGRPQPADQLGGPVPRRHQYQHAVRTHPVDQLEDHERGVEGRGQPDHRRAATRPVLGRGQHRVDQFHRAPARRHGHPGATTVGDGAAQGGSGRGLRPDPSDHPRR